MATHKIVKVRITRKTGGGMQYPAGYHTSEVDEYGIGPTNIMPGGAAYSGGLSRGDSEGHCIIILPNTLADTYATDSDMEIITAAVADALMDKWRALKGKPVEVVMDQARIAAVTAKQAAGIRLTAEDELALDPNSSVPGINRALIPLLEKFATILE